MEWFARREDFPHGLVDRLQTERKRGIWDSGLDLLEYCPWCQIGLACVQERESEVVKDPQSQIFGQPGR